MICNYRKGTALMRSMTGFGQGSAEGERFRVAVTLRAVNHRYLDLVLRLKDEVRSAERDLRNLLTEVLERGRVEAVFDFEAVGDRGAKIVVDRALAKSLRGAVDELASAGLLASEITLSDLLRLPEALKVEAQDDPWSSEDLDLLFAATRRALAQLTEARSVEGKTLETVVLERISLLRELHQKMVGLAAALPEQLATALAERIEHLVDSDSLPDGTRIAQEVALLVDRTDVSEELDRLVSHLDHFEQIVGAEGSIGKRLDFLSQEIFRELNTIGSKCRDAPLVRLVLEAKFLVEQIREQVQNVE